MIRQVIKNERAASKFRKVLNIGDTVSFSSSRSISAEVSKIEGDEVTIIVKLHKNGLYPDYEK